MNVVTTWKSNVTHITDDSSNGDTVKTRCGRTLRQYMYGHFGTEQCPKCGSVQEYEAIHRHNAQLRQEKEEMQHRLAEANRKLEQTKSTVRKAIAKEIVDRTGGTVVEVNEYMRCTNYVIEVEGYKFEIKAQL